jgi:hypothetical protein
MMRVLSALLAVGFVVAGCAGPEATLEVAAHAGETVATDQGSYASGQAVTVTWAGLPGNANDWVAIAPAGSPATTVLAWRYTGGSAGGSRVFQAPTSSGSYVARAFANDSYVQLAESAPFTVASSSITSDQPSYATGETITITWSGLPGNAHDFIGISPTGSLPNVLSAWRYATGAAGSFAFTGIPNGVYVARAYLDDSYSVLVESAPFTISAATTVTVATDKTFYTLGEDVVITWSGLAGPQDWIAMSPVGGLPSDIVRWTYVPGASGSLTFPAPGLGSYEIRAYINNQYILVGTSPQFTVGATISTNKSTYVANEDIFVTTTGGGTRVRIATPGSPASSFVGQTFADGPQPYKVDGVAAAGTYVARLVNEFTNTIVGESAPFTVIVQPKVEFVGNAYNLLRWYNLPGNAKDWVALAPAGSPVTTVIGWGYVNSQPNGIRQIQAIIPGPGTYVARAFENDTYTLLAESDPLTVP